MSAWSRIRSRYESFMTQLDEKLHQKNAFTLQLEKIEKKTKISRLKIVQVILLLLLAIFFFVLGSELISNSIGFLYPAYASIKAIESLNKDDDTRWLTYWVVYGSFIFVESITDCFLSWFPFYWVTKCLFLVWCMLPTPNNGSDFIYSFLLKPFFLKHHKDIDMAIDNAHASAKCYIDNVTSVIQTNPSVPRNYQQPYKHGHSNYYDERDAEASYSGRLGELRHKYGGDQRMSPERSLDMSRARLFNDGRRSGSRSPERSARERRYSNERVPDEMMNRSRKYQDSMDYNRPRSPNQGSAYASNAHATNGGAYVSHGHSKSKSRQSVRKDG